jgi:hypothetical protein
MLGIILDILAMDDFYGISEEIEIAKGKNKLCTKWGEAWKQSKRKKKWPKR